MTLQKATAELFFRRDKIIVAGYSYLRSGGSTINGWIEQTSQSVDDSALGGILRSALASTQHDVPSPDRRTVNPNLEKFLSIVGVKTYGQFMKGAAQVIVIVAGGNVTYLPSRNLGARNGFEPIPEQMLEVAYDSATDIILGSFAIKAYTRCE